MSRLGPEPRINSRLLEQFKGQTVRLTAKVIKLSGDTATVEASDGGQPYFISRGNELIYRSDYIYHDSVLINQDMHLTDGYYEIIGNVKEDKSVKALTSIELGPQLDMKAVDALVELSNSPKGQGVLS